MDQLLPAQEKLTCQLILEFAKELFQKPENHLRYEEWLHQQESATHKE